MSIAQTSSGRSPHDLSHLIFSAGQIGRLQTLSVVPVIAGDSYSQNLTAALKLSPLRRGLTMDSVVEVFTFYVPHRHVYGDEWNQFIMDGVNATPLTQAISVASADTAKLNHLGINGTEELNYDNPTLIPKWAKEGYDLIFNNYFKYPEDDDHSHTFADMDLDMGKYGYACAMKAAPWTTPLPDQGTDRELEIPSDGSTATINVQELNQQYGSLHTEEERELFGQRYRDVISNMGGSTHYDADNRPRLLGRTEQWASGYDVDGTDETSLGSHVGRINQDISHNINRTFIPEHGAIWTVAVVRFPTVQTQEANYLTKTPNPTYEELAGDPAIVANHPRIAVDRSKFQVADDAVARPMGEFAHSYWYRHHCNTVHTDYANLQGYPFLKLGMESVTDARYKYVKPYQYNDIFQTEQLAQWNMQARMNINVMRALPTTRDSIITSN